MFIFFFVIFCVVNHSGSTVNFTEDFRKIADQSSIIFSLSKYNASNPNGESIESFYTLSPYSLSKIVVTDIPIDIHFVVVQVHSYLLNTTLSYDKTPLLNTSVSGSNIGLLKINENKDVIFYLTYNNSLEDVDVMVAVQAYKKDAPVPGGCNMEFKVEVSPFLQVTYNDATTEVDFAPGAPPISVLPTSFLYSNSECNIKPSPVQHYMYHKYFPEKDFSKETYFNIIKGLMTKSRIHENGVLAPEKLTSSPVRRIFATYPGTGNAFVVVAQYGNQTSIYVPSFTYACSDVKENNTCQVLSTTFSKVLCASILFMGLFACFVGHYFFRTEMFLFGFLISGIVAYILVTILFDNSIALAAAVSLGFFVASSMILFWTVFGIPVVSVTLTTLTFGFFLASVLFYFLTDYINVMVLDINYWGIFVGIVVSCPMLMFFMAEKGNIISCAVLGSYIAILSIDHYIGSNLRYVVLNTIRRATENKFSLAIIGPPFQANDLILTIGWLLLTLMGITAQIFLMRNKPPFPPPVNPLKKLLQRLVGPSTVVSSEPTESSPLLREPLPGYGNTL